MRYLRALLCVATLTAAQAATPRIDYATFLGGIYADSGVAIAVDSSGAAYVAGNTNSPDFPLTSTAFGSPDLGQGCGFLTKLNPTGTAIDFSVCLANSAAMAMGLDANANIYLLVNRGSEDALVKLDPSASAILYNVTVSAVPEAIAVDGAGNVYVTGLAYAGLPATAGAYQTQYVPGGCPTPAPTGPCPHAFVMKFSPSGSLIYSTYLGGSGADYAHSIAADSAGNAWIAGETLSPDFPTTANAVSRTFGGEVVATGGGTFGDAFVAELGPAGAKLLYSTYLGGSAADGAFGIAIDAAGSAYVAGTTQSADFPVTPGALHTAFPCAIPGDGLVNGIGFVVKFSASGTLVYSTFFGAPEQGGLGTVVADSLGQAYVSLRAGPDPQAGPPTVTCAAPAAPQISVLNASGSAIVASSRVAGSSLALDAAGSLYATGTTYTQVFFSTLHAFQTEYGGDSDAFAAKLDFTKPPLPALTCLVNAASLLEGNLVSYGFPNGAVAPGELVALLGNGFGTQPTVNIGNIEAPILYASDTQINAVVPFEAADPAVVTVSSGAQTIGLVKLPKVDVVPAVFTINESGTGQGAILNQDGTVNSPTNPAPRGSIVSLWMTGTGLMSPSIADGAIGPLSPPFPMPVLSVSIEIGENAYTRPVPAPVVWAGQAPALVAGVTQVNLQIPLSAPTGVEPIWVEIEGIANPMATIAID